MPASKKKNFTIEENEIALVGRALAHPARVRILHLLDTQNYIRNCDLVKSLQLCKSTVHDHLKKLEEAELIKSDYFMNSFYISKASSTNIHLHDFNDVKSNFS